MRKKAALPTKAEVTVTRSTRGSVRLDDDQTEMLIRDWFRQTFPEFAEADVNIQFDVGEGFRGVMIVAEQKSVD